MQKGGLLDLASQTNFKLWQPLLAVLKPKWKTSLKWLIAKSDSKPKWAPSLRKLPTKKWLPNNIGLCQHKITYTTNLELGS